MSIRFPTPAGVLLAILPVLPLQAQVSPTLRILQVEALSGDMLKLVLEQTGTNVVDHRLVHTDSVIAGTTNFDLQARFVALGGGRYETVIPRPPTSPRFYQVAGFSGPDTDGDGLTDDLERLIGTNPATFDTDQDGFGDGVELAHESSPNNHLSQPVIQWANFASTSSSVREGGQSISLVVNFTFPFSGMLGYQVANMSTAVAGADYQLPAGSVSVSGTSARITITLIDDDLIEPTKLLAVDLKPDAAGRYRVGGASRHTVLLLDNDVHWSGTMLTSMAELGFRLRMLRRNGNLTAELVSELSPGGSQGVGSIPLGVWPLRATYTTAGFNAASDPITMGTSPLTGDAPLERLLTFTATAGHANHVIRSNLIIGEFTDILRSTRPDMAWVGNTVTGIVMLVEDLPLPPARQLPGEGVRDLRAASMKGGAQ